MKLHRWNAGGGGGGGSSIHMVKVVNNSFTKYHCDLMGSCYGGPAINAKQAQCARQALSKNAVALTLDAAGFVPGESIAAILFQVGVGATSTVYSAAHGDTTGSFMGIAGTQLAAFAPFAKQAGWGIAKAVPGFGTALNVFATGKDAYTAYTDYLSCMNAN